MKKGWSRAELARELASVGCGLTEADLYNVEGPGPSRRPRSVRVDELAALSEVFGIPIPELLAPLERHMADEVTLLVHLMRVAQDDMRSAYKSLRYYVAELIKYAEDDPIRDDFLAESDRLENAVAGAIVAADVLAESLREKAADP